MYQVPVLQIESLPYGEYNVTITATYMAPMDKTTADGYWLYLDAIRIYDPANDGASNKIIEDAYVVDGEGWPSYIELRNHIIAAGTFGNATTKTEVTGLVFIDGKAAVGDAKIEEYINYGPNNEVYLAPDQRVAFILNTPGNIDSVHIGVKSADGKACSYEIANIALKSDSENKVEAGQYYGKIERTVDTTTDMYYDITGWAKHGDVIVISNIGGTTGGTISLTNIKSTYKTNPNGSVMTASLDDQTGNEEFFETYAYMTLKAVALTLDGLNVTVEEETEQTPVTDTDRPANSRPVKPGQQESSKPAKVEKPTKPNNSGNSGADKNNKPNSIRVNGWFF